MFPTNFLPGVLGVNGVQTDANGYVIAASVVGTVSANVVQWSGTPSQLAADNTPLVSISANDAVHTAAASLNGMISAGAYTSGALVHSPTSGGTAIITNEQAIIQ